MGQEFRKHVNDLSEQNKNTVQTQYKIKTKEPKDGQQTMR